MNRMFTFKCATIQLLVTTASTVPSLDSLVLTMCGKKYETARTLVHTKLPMLSEIERSWCKYQRCSFFNFHTCYFRYIKYRLYWPIPLQRVYSCHDRNSANYNEINNQIVKSLIEYLNGLKNHGVKYELVESTIEILLAAVSVESSNSTEVGKSLGISRKRISAAKEKRMLFDSAVDKKKWKNIK